MDEHDDAPTIDPDPDLDDVIEGTVESESEPVKLISKSALQYHPRVAEAPELLVDDAVGVVLGIFVHTLFASLGLAIILSTSAIAFSIVKLLGAGYLIYLGIRSLRDKNTFHLDRSKSSKKLHTIMAQGILSNVLNPKVALFFLAFLPQFASSENGPVAVQMMILGLLFAGFGLVFLVTIGYFAGAIGNWLSMRKSVYRRIRWLTGSILVGLGLRLVFMEYK